MHNVDLMLQNQVWHSIKTKNDLKNKNSGRTNLNTVD